MQCKIKQVRVQLPTSPDNVSLPAFTAERCAVAKLRLGTWRLPWLIGISCYDGARQQTRQNGMQWANGGTEKQTEGRPTAI